MPIPSTADLERQFFRVDTEVSVDEAIWKLIKTAVDSGVTADDVIGFFADNLETLASKAGVEFEGSEPIPIDNVTAAILVTMPDTDVNGVVVKVSGNDTLYGHGQAFVVLEEGVGDAEDSGATGSVLFRVDAKGSLGLTGGIHVMSGFRKVYGGTQAVWIDPSENTHGLVVHNPSVAESASWSSDYIRVVDTRNANALVFRVESTGKVSSTENMQAQSTTSEQVTIGDIFGVPAIGLGLASDCLMFRSAAGIIGVANAFEFSEVAAPAAPAANKSRLFTQDNGSGKTQLAVRFPTGAVQVLATEP